MGHATKLIVAAALVAILPGCRNIAPELAIADVSADVKDRIGQTIEWDSGRPEDEIARQHVRRLLARPLTPEAAIRVALLNNRELQAAYASVGIAQANMVQAGLLKNPILDAAVTWPDDTGGTPNISFAVAWSFLSLLQMPLREAVAESELEEAKLRVARQVIAHAADTYAAYIDYVAARQETELMSTAVESARAALTAAEALREAGNITRLELNREAAFLNEVKLELASAEAREAETREALNVLMGVSGAQTDWRAPERLPQMRSNPLDTHDVERRAVSRSLEIALGRQRLTTLGRRFQLVKQASLLPELDIGAEYEREAEAEEGATNIREALGPSLGIAIPIFDYGQARRAGAYLEIRRAEDQLWQTAVRVRSAARLMRARLLQARKTAAFHKDEVLPQSQKILGESQRQYNAMQLGVFQLLQAKRQQIAAGRQYIRALRGYWQAVVRFHQLMSGSLPDAGAGEMAEVAAADGQGNDEGGH